MNINTKIIVLLTLSFVPALLISIETKAKSDAAIVEPTPRYQLELEPIVQKRGLWGTISSAFRRLQLRTTGVLYPSPGTKFRVTAVSYSSTPSQTDSTPYITATGTSVRWGIVATNFLPIGTKLRIGDEIFVVEDRMNARYDGVPIIDIWHPTTQQARNFGKKSVEVEILGKVKPGTDLSKFSLESPLATTEEPAQERNRDQNGKESFLTRVLQAIRSLPSDVENLLTR